jgi:hypothetical protein
MDLLSYLAGLILLFAMLVAWVFEGDWFDD